MATRKKAAGKAAAKKVAKKQAAKRPTSKMTAQKADAVRKSGVVADLPPPSTKPWGEAGKALESAFPRFADDLAWWVEAAKAQRERKRPPF